MAATASTVPTEIKETRRADTLAPSRRNAWDGLASIKERAETVGATASDSIASVATGSAVYNLDKFVKTIKDIYYANTPLLQRNQFLMKSVFHGDIKLTKAVKDEIKANLASMAANSLTVAKELERAVAGMAALATPPGSPYKNINQDQIMSLYYMISSIDGITFNLRLVITDKQGSTYIRPFLWDFASQEILQGQRFASRMEKPLRQLLPFIRASKIATDKADYYAHAREYILTLVGTDGNLKKYVNWPAPPHGANEAPEVMLRGPAEDHEIAAAAATATVENGDDDDGSASLLQGRSARADVALGN